MVIAVLACAVCSQALAQTSTVPRVGQRVRVTSAFERTPSMKGWVGSVTADTLFLHPTNRMGDVATAIPLAGIARLDVSQGRRSHLVRGLLIGAALGATTGAVLGAASRDEDDWLVLTEVTMLYGVVVFTPLGAGVGLLVGALWKTEQWETVPLDRVGPHVASGPDGRLSLGARVTF
jgi:hypothetical protein